MVNITKTDTRHDDDTETICSSVLVDFLHTYSKKRTQSFAQLTRAHYCWQTFALEACVFVYPVALSTQLSLAKGEKDQQEKRNQLHQSKGHISGPQPSRTLRKPLVFRNASLSLKPGPQKTLHKTIKHSWKCVAAALRIYFGVDSNIAMNSSDYLTPFV